MRSRTYLQNFLIRSISAAGWDAAVKYAYTMKVYPLAQESNPAETTFLDISGTVYRAAPLFDAGYFDLINMLVQEEPVNDYDKTMLGMVMEGFDLAGFSGQPECLGRDFQELAALPRLSQGSISSSAGLNTGIRRRPGSQ
jgi:hypothetical protein